MAQGASTPIEVRVAGKNMDDIKAYAKRLVDTLKGISFLRDVQITQPLNLPTIQITIDRNKLVLMGLSINTPHSPGDSVPVSYVVHYYHRAEDACWLCNRPDRASPQSDAV